jgi:rhamnopyranosyl-N-acetylglucosaminyl-diphospho-decaprenol beta-1,3/1,4-galactofuranosyltransferase
MNQPILIAIVIVTYNRCELLKKNLASIDKQIADIYIIDNNSSDDTHSVVEEFRLNSGRNIYYHNTCQNLGGAGGFRVGCEMALQSENPYTHLWLTDDDVIFSNDCLSQLAPYIDCETILQPMRMYENGDCAEESSTKIDLKSFFILDHKRCSIKNSPFAFADEPFSIDMVPFEGPLIPVDVFDNIGLPDESFFIFSDDLDFSIRAKKAGFKITCVPNAKIIRMLRHSTSFRLKSWKDYFRYRNFFRIQYVYGENVFVRNRPLIIFALALLLNFFLLDFQAITMLKDALVDSRKNPMKLNGKYLPG